MNRVINWFGVAAGVTTLLVVAVSLFVPWWQLSVGEDLVQVNASPVNTNFGLFGTPFTVPLIWALNLVSILTLVASGAIMLLYSVVPTKPYAKELLGFSYKKPFVCRSGFSGYFSSANVNCWGTWIEPSINGHSERYFTCKFHVGRQY